MKPTIIFAIALLLCAASNTFAQSGDKKLEQKFLQRQRAEDEAETKRDAAALERIFSDDFVFTAPSGAVFDKKKFLGEIKAETEPASPQKLDYENFKVRAYGSKTVMVNYVLVVSSIDKAGKDSANRYRMSVLWIKQKGAWRITNFHSTRVRT